MTTPDGTIKFNPQLVRSLIARCRVEQSDIEASGAWLRRAVFAQEPLQAAGAGTGGSSFTP